MPTLELTEDEQRLLNNAVSEAFRDEPESTQEEATNVTEQTQTEENEVRETDEREEDERRIDSEAEISGSINTSRFSGAPWFERASNIEVTVGGCGGIGSYLTFFLSRINVGHIIVYDPDTVDATNMAGQLFSNSSIGLKKVDAISNFINDYSSYHKIYCIDRRFDDTTTGTPVMLSGFDNMKARKDYFNAWMNIVNATPQNLRKNLLYIDGRLSAERFQIFCLRGNYTWAIEDYKTNWLFDDSEAESDVCSYKQTTFCAAMIASMMVGLFVNWVTNLEGGVRSIPYFTEYNSEFICLERR